MGLAGVGGVLRQTWHKDGLTGYHWAWRRVGRIWLGTRESKHGPVALREGPAKPSTRAGKSGAVRGHVPQSCVHEAGTPGPASLGESLNFPEPEVPQG